MIALLALLATSGAVEYSLDGDPVALVDGGVAARIYPLVASEVGTEPVVVVLSQAQLAHVRHRSVPVSVRSVTVVDLYVPDLPAEALGLSTVRGRVVRGIVDDAFAQRAVGYVYSHNLNGARCPAGALVETLVAPSVLNAGVLGTLPRGTNRLALVGFTYDVMPGMTRLDPRDTGGLDLVGINPEPKTPAGCMDSGHP